MKTCYPNFEKPDKECQKIIQNYERKVREEPLPTLHEEYQIKIETTQKHYISKYNQPDIQPLQIKILAYKDINKIMEEIQSKAYDALINEFKEESDEEESEKPVLTLEMLTQSFQDFVKTFLHQNILEVSEEADELVAEVMLMSVIVSIDFLKHRCPDCEVFLRLLISEYQFDELKYFIFTRAMVEKELERKFHHENIRDRIDPKSTVLDMDTVYSLMEAMFGFGNFKRQKSFLDKLQSLDESFRMRKKINVHKFLFIALYDYCSYSVTFEKESKKPENADSNRLFNELYQPINATNKTYTLNPKVYNKGASNYLEKYNNFLKDKTKQPTRKFKNQAELNPKRNLYQDFTVLHKENIDDVTAMYSTTVMFQNMEKTRFKQIGQKTLNHPTITGGKKPKDTPPPKTPKKLLDSNKSGSKYLSQIEVASSRKSSVKNGSKNNIENDENVNEIPESV